MRPRKFLQIVKEEAGLNNLEESKIATLVVFDLLHHRITKAEAEDVRSQLPEELAHIWEGGDIWYNRLLAKFEPHNKFNRTEFINQVNARKQDLMATGEKITKAVFYALQSQITEGEAADVSAQLPRDLRALWEEAKPLSIPVGAGGETEPPGLIDGGGKDSQIF